MFATHIHVIGNMLKITQYACSDNLSLLITAHGKKKKYMRTPGIKLVTLKIAI
jgi:hypothetical protein